MRLMDQVRKALGKRREEETKVHQSSRAEYASLLQRADQPKAGDAARLLDLAAVLNYAPDDVEKHLAHIDRVAALRATAAEVPALRAAAEGPLAEGLKDSQAGTERAKAAEMAALGRLNDGMDALGRAIQAERQLPAALKDLDLLGLLAKD